MVRADQNDAVITNDLDKALFFAQCVHHVIDKIIGVERNQQMQLVRPILQSLCDGNEALFIGCNGLQWGGGPATCKISSSPRLTHAQHILILVSHRQVGRVRNHHAQIGLI